VQRAGVAALLAAVIPRVQATHAERVGTDVARGRYLVEQVGLCVECHTPRLADGSLDRSRWLQGAPVVVDPPPFVRAWAVKAPRIGGLTTYDDAQLVRLLTEGIGRDGTPLRPPMPQYRMTADDARAIAAYLRGAK
jgi:mono/diheme cytochrome c family protein